MGKTIGPPVNTGSQQGWIQANLQRMPKSITALLAVMQAPTQNCLVELYSRPAAERCYQSYAHSKRSRILQSTVPGPQTRQLMEPSYRLQFPKQIPGHTKIQDGDCRILENIRNILKWLKCLQNVNKIYLTPILWFSKCFQVNVYAVMFKNVL